MNLSEARRYIAQNGQEDAEFISTARILMPKLLAVVKAVQIYLAGDLYEHRDALDEALADIERG